MRSGDYALQRGGFSTFVPAPLPPEPPVQFDVELVKLLSNADRALGRLDGVTSMLPNPDLFVAMYVRYEAVLSSQIEGTQSTYSTANRLIAQFTSLGILREVNTQRRNKQFQYTPYLDLFEQPSLEVL